MKLLSRGIKILTATFRTLVFNIKVRTYFKILDIKLAFYQFEDQTKIKIRHFREAHNL